MTYKPALLDLPAELLVDILSFLDFSHILRCQTVSHTIDHLIHTSAKLQYIIELGVAGYVDGAPEHPFNTFQRLNYLKARQDEWKNPELGVIRTIPLMGLPIQWDIRAGVFMRAMNTGKFGISGFDTIRTFRLRPTAEDLPEQIISLDSSFSGIKFDPGPSQDLLILFQRHPRFPSTSFEIVLLSLRTGMPHHSATNPVLRIPFVCHPARFCDVGVDIWDELLVVNLLNGKEVHVHFFDWRLGVIVATLPDQDLTLRVRSMCRLSTRRFAILTYKLDSDPQMFVLDVFELDPFHTEGDLPRTPKHLARYQFPRMRFEHPPQTSITSSFPLSSPPSLEDDYSPPSMAAPSSGLICIHMFPAYPPIRCHVFILPTPFLTVEHNFDGTPSIHPWSSWGQSATRWFKSSTINIPLDNKPYAYRVGSLGLVLDFNPRDIARDLCRDANMPKPQFLSRPGGDEWNGPYDDEPTPSRIVTDPTIIFSDEHFKETIISSLAYRETMFETPVGAQRSNWFVQEDLYYIEFEGVVHPTALHICSI